MLSSFDPEALLVALISAVITLTALVYFLDHL